MEPIPSAGWLPAALESSRALDDFEGVVRLYWLKVFRFALASLRDRDAAESLAQDCFLNAYRARAGFRGDSSISTWLMQIAVNLIRDRVRDRRFQFWRRAGTTNVELTAAGRWLPDGAASPEVRAQARQQIEAVWAVTQELPERQRTIFLLRFVEDMNLLEIAAVTGLKEGTVKVHLFRALQAVRGRLGAGK